jgi:hypothetical protein
VIRTTKNRKEDTLETPYLSTENSSTLNERLVGSEREPCPVRRVRQRERERMRTSVVGGGWNISAITVRHARQRGWGGRDGRRRGGRESEVGRDAALETWELFFSFSFHQTYLRVGLGTWCNVLAGLILIDGPWICFPFCFDVSPMFFK